MLWMCSQILLNLLMFPEMRVKVIAWRQADGVSEADTGERSTCIRTCKHSGVLLSHLEILVHYICICGT